MTLTDEEIRVKVAELMGWRFVGDYTKGMRVISPTGEESQGFSYSIHTAIWDIPDYLHDPAAALQLCDRMHSEGWTVEQIRRPGEDWIVSLFKGVIAGPSTSDHSLARAVTLCFLKCHE